MQKFQADSDNAFSFYEVFCEQHHLQSVPRGSVVLYCIFIEINFEK